MTDLTIVRGEDEVIEFALKDPDPLAAPGPDPYDPDDPSTWGPLDLTGCTLRWMAKRSAGEPDSGALITKVTGAGITITDAAGGLAEVAIAAADTRDLGHFDIMRPAYHALQVKDAAGTIQRADHGRLTIEPDVVHATS